MIRKKEGFQGQKAVVIPRKIITEQCDQNDIIGTLYITDIGYYPNAKFHYRERPDGAGQHILIYCHKGSGSVQIQKEKYTIEAGDFCMVPMKAAHSYAANEQNPWTIYWMHFKGSISQSIIDLFEKRTGGYKGFISNSDCCISLFNEIYNQLERGYSADNLIYANMCLWHFLTTFIYNSKCEVAGSAKQREVSDVAIDFLRKNIDRSVTLEEIAGTVNLSPPHFSLLFKAKTGFPPIEYFNHLKVQKACQYLLFTSLRIKEISLELGIGDQYYFSRMFKKIMGMSPNEYREKRIQ
jgi:AraC-like DNA-binding protein